MAANGYPGDYAKGTRDRGTRAAAQGRGRRIFHAGTAREDGQDPRQWRPRAERLRARQDRRRGAARAYEAVDASTGPRVSAAATSAGGRWSGRRRAVRAYPAREARSELTQDILPTAMAVNFSASSPRNGCAVIAGGESLAVHLNRQGEPRRCGHSNCSHPSRPARERGRLRMTVLLYCLNFHRRALKKSRSISADSFSPTAG